MLPELEMSKLKVVSGMSHIKEEHNGLEDPMLLSFNSKSQRKIHLVLPMVLTLRELLRPKRSSLTKKKRRMLPPLNKNPMRINMPIKLLLRERSETVTSNTKPLVVSNTILTQKPPQTFPNSFVQEEPAAAKPAEEATAAAPKEGEVKPEGKENQAKSPGPKDKLGWANQTKKEGLSESAEVVKKQ